MENNIIKIPPILLYDLIDECVLSTSWNSFTGVTDVGFGYPGQFLNLQQMDKTPGQLTMDEKRWLIDPKTYGEKLEWLVESCFQNVAFVKLHVLCLNNKPSDCKELHEDVLLSNWEPLGRHENLVMKVFPDDFGVGKLPLCHFGD